MTLFQSRPSISDSSADLPQQRKATTSNASESPATSIQQHNSNNQQPSLSGNRRSEFLHQFFQLGRLAASLEDVSEALNRTQSILQTIDQATSQEEGILARVANNLQQAAGVSTIVQLKNEGGGVRELDQAANKEDYVAEAKARPRVLTLMSHSGEVNETSAQDRYDEQATTEYDIDSADRERRKKINKKRRETRRKSKENTDAGKGLK